MAYSSDTPEVGESGEARHRARRRALRAAQVVTLCLGLATGGCGGDEGVGAVDAGRAADSGMVADSGAGMDAGGGSDGGSGEDAGGAIDSGLADAGSVTDGGERDGGEVGFDAGVCGAPEADGVCPPGVSPSDDADCCCMSGGFWISGGGGCAVPGPFVPPSMIV